MSPDLRDFIERTIGYYQADSRWRRERREAQIIALAEVLRYADGDTRMSDQLEELVPVGLHDLPRRLGGTIADGSPLDTRGQS